MSWGNTQIQFCKLKSGAFSGFGGFVLCRMWQNAN